MITNPVRTTLGVVQPAVRTTSLFVDVFIEAPPVEPSEDPVDVNSDGGEVLSWTLPEDAVADGEYYVDVAVDLADEEAYVRAYSGRPGHANRSRVAGGVLTFAVPRVAPAEGYRALLTDVETLEPVAATTVLFHARRRPLFSGVFELRASLPNRWAVGPDDPRDEVVA